MKGLRTLIRVRRRQLDEKRRELKDLEHLAAELNGRLDSLATELRDEQVQARESVEVGFSYGGYAQAVIARRVAACPQSLSGYTSGGGAPRRW